MCSACARARLVKDPAYLAKVRASAQDPARNEKLRRAATTPERREKASREQRDRFATSEARASQVENGRKGAAKRWGQTAPVNGTPIRDAIPCSTCTSNE